MFNPILLSMIAAAAGVGATAPDPTIRVSLNSNGQYLPGDRSKVQVITRDDGYLVVFQVSPEGRLRVLFPLDPTDDNYVKGGKRYLLLGRGGREGFTVDVAGSGAVFAAVSYDPWRFNGYVQNDHWDYRALNTVTYDDTEPQLVELSQAMAGGRFDYDILGYTVASQVAYADDGVAVTGGVGGLAGCFGCEATPVAVIYGTGYNNTWGLYDPWYYAPYYNYGPYYPAWGYGPYWGAGWGNPYWNSGYWNNGYWGGGYGGGGYWGGYYPPYPTAVPYAGYQPYQKKQWDRTWNGAPVPYRPRGDYGYTATNTVAGAVPGIGVQQHASFRNRTWSDGQAIAGGSARSVDAVPVSKGSSVGTSSARRRDVAPSASATPSAKAARPSTPGTSPFKPSTRSGSATATTPTASTPSTNRQVFRPEARAARPTSERARVTTAPDASAGASPFERKMPVQTRWPSAAPAEGVPVSRAAPDTPPATKAANEGRSSEPVLRRRETEQKPAPAAAAPAPAPRQENSGQQNRAPDRGYSSPPSPPPSQPSGASGGNFSGGGRSASPPPSSAPPSAVSGGGRRR